MNLRAILFLLCAFSFLVGNAQIRSEIPFNDQWTFQGTSVAGRTYEKIVSLPHTWNAKDAQEGIKYYRGTGNYSKYFEVEEEWKGKRIFIRFEGSNIKTRVSLNGQELGEHKGGYAAFIFEITDYILFDQTNSIEVVVSNEENLEVIPLVGDFNNYGGIYRPVSLLITHPVCITPLDYASPGIFIYQENVTGATAHVKVLTKISNKLGDSVAISCRTSILDANDELVDTQITSHSLDTSETALIHSYTIKNPHLWNGRQDPYMYKVKVDILVDENIIDSKTEPLGLRYFHVDANEGFFLNGKPVDLRGVSRHQDRKDKGSAISEADHREDMELMLDMGINALRLAHYQHAEIIYDLADSAGLMVWAELPWVGAPGSFMGSSNGFEDTDSFYATSKQQLYELIRQNFNHPSILMWSIYNELQNPEGASPIKFINELNDMVKKEDPGRLSVAASMLSPQDHPGMHDVTDLIAWNRYFGWYYKMPKDMGSFLDRAHEEFPDLKIAISEYGAGGSIAQHSDKLVPPNPMGSPHPEEWQAYYHEENLKIFDERPFVWGTFIWNMFDFGSHFRKEGDHYGINDKGMITYDRKTKKDAFYFYKANWSDEPVLKITSSRYIFRKKAKTKVKVYTNLDSVSLTINGKDFPEKSPEKGIIIWGNITLDEGNNGVLVEATVNGKTYTDDCLWVIENPYAGMNLFIKIFDFMSIAYQIGIGGFVLVLLIWFFGIRQLKERQRTKRILAWVFVALISLVSLLIIAGKFALSNLMGG